MRAAPPLFGGRILRKAVSVIGQGGVDENTYVANVNVRTEGGKIEIAALGERILPQKQRKFVPQKRTGPIRLFLSTRRRILRVSRTNPEEVS